MLDMFDNFIILFHDKLLDIVYKTNNFVTFCRFYYMNYKLCLDFFIYISTGNFFFQFSNFTIEIGNGNNCLFYNLRLSNIFFGKWRKNID